MSGKYGRTEVYTSLFPTRAQVGGTCTDCSVAYAMEMVGLLTGQPVAQLSQLFLDWKQGGRGGGGLSEWAAAQAGTGVCAEHLWPSSLTFGPEQWLTGVNSYEQLRAIEYTAPDAVCFADAVNAKILEWSFLATGSKAEIMAAIDAGYALTMFVVAPNHEEVLWDYDNTGVIGLDSHSSSIGPTHFDWADKEGAWSPRVVIKRVQFTGIATRARINPYSPNNNVSIVQAMRAQLAPLQSSVSAPMLAKINALTAISANDIHDLWTLTSALAPAPVRGLLASMVNALVLDAALPPPPPPPTGDAQLIATALAKLQNARELIQ